MQPLPIKIPGKFCRKAQHQSMSKNFANNSKQISVMAKQLSAFFKHEECLNLHNGGRDH